MAKLSEILGTSFDSTTVEPREDFTGELLPAGTYTVEILDAEVKATKAGTGQILKIDHQVIDPAQYAKRRVWKSINVANANVQAEQIGRSELSGLCRAAGIAVLDETDQLIGKVVKVKVAIRKGKDGYADQNEVKAYESAQIAPVPTPGAPARTQPRATPPWANK